MDDKDKEAFEKWWMEGFKGMSDIDVIKYKDVGKQTSLNGWQAACEHKQKEIDELLEQLKHEHDLYKKHLKVYEDENAKLIEQDQIISQEIKTYIHIADRLQAENTKLKECVKFYAKEGNWDDRILLILDDTEDTAYSSYNGGKRARQVLKELYKGETK